MTNRTIPYLIPSSGGAVVAVSFLYGLSNIFCVFTFETRPPVGANENDGKRGKIDLTMGIQQAVTPAESRQYCRLCNRNASFGWAGASGLWTDVFCSYCKKNCSAETNVTMLKLNGRCVRCSRIATFGLAGGRPNNARHCRLHRLISELDLRHPRCNFVEGCLRRASFGEREGHVLFCARHKQSDHVDTLHKRCQIGGCARRALYGNFSSGPSYCKSHKSEQDRNTAIRGCQEPNCARSAFYGDPALRRPLFCSRHRRPLHADVVNKMCEWHVGGGCGRQAFYGDAGGRAAFCAAHRQPGHERVRGAPRPQ